MRERLTNFSWETATCLADVISGGQSGLNSGDTKGLSMGKFLFRLFTGLHAKIIKLSKGKLLAGSTLVLTHTGAKSGKVRDTPLMYFKDGTDHLIIASAGGAPSHPGWYHNLMANPDTTIQVKGETIQVTASDAGQARDELWAKITSAEPRFAAYEGKTSRTIPVVVLSPR